MRNAYQISQDEQILQANPVELVIMLYRTAVDAVRLARQHLTAGDIAERGRQISRTSAILTELAISLNHEVGGSLSQNLAELYDYLQRLLTAAHLEQSDAKLSQAQNLLETMLEGWTAAQNAASAPSVSAPMYQWTEPTIHEPVSYRF